MDNLNQVKSPLTFDKLLEDGYTIKNAKIKKVALSMEDHGVLTLYVTLEGDGWGVCYGGYVLGKGYVGAKEFKGSAKGLESIMRVMDTIGVDELTKAVGKYVRVATNGFGSMVKIIGNIIEDKWFDYDTFFKDETSQ